MSVAYGALDGLVVEIVVFYGRIAAWQTARHGAPARNEQREQLPRLDKYVDPPSDVLTALTRLSLGAGGGWIFSPQLTGALATVAVGASAPALLRRLGSARTQQAVIGGAPSAPVPAPAGSEDPGVLPGGAEVIES
ncbi:hypothetical protein [Streptomyces herbicida]|uniref:hypothetical protein n=1 Tax=Streptomyces herbicida TaxID=3065675 RepID=UPI00292D4ED1|nr:hypothetical protein [Streptomyces sp. NEAU-HV9]